MPISQGYIKVVVARHLFSELSPARYQQFRTRSKSQKNYIAVLPLFPMISDQCFADPVRQELWL